MTNEESSSHRAGNEEASTSDRRPEARIARFMRANPTSKQEISDQELEQLRAAAQRLDQLLLDGANAEVQALRDAAARLDRLLNEVAAGEDVTSKFIRRRDRNSLSN